jgi:hypothetical protein
MTDLSVFSENGIVFQNLAEEFERICDRMDIFTIEQWMPFWTRNAAANYHTVPTDPKKLRTLSHLKNIHWGKEAAILASGPSLDESIQYLKKFRGLIFAGNSTINPCIGNGIMPDWVHILDADEMVPKQFMGIDCSNFKAIIPTYIHPDSVALFNPDLVWWMNIFDHRHWLTKNGLHDLFPNVDALLASSTCPTAMIRLAYWMGIRKMYVLGADFGFPNGQRRCSIYMRENGSWLKAGQDEWAMDKGAIEIINGIETTMKLRVSHRAFAESCKLLPGLELIDCSKGIMNEFPKIDFKEVVNGSVGKV